MAKSLDQLSQTILNKSFDDCSEGELYNLSNRYPYFAPAQFLYLKKLDLQSDEYARQFQKAVLYYNEPVLFEPFLQMLAEELEIEQPQIEIQHHETVQETFPDENITTISSPTLPDPDPVSLTKPNRDLKDPVADNGITFEPFHTVDYFASQGIKLSKEDASKDKFGKQVKSFTEWLKTMKRLQTTQLNTIQGQAEKQVVNMAAHSVQTTDVVTESMAEVWIHQGNKAKAKEVYRKLSLLNPSKSAYFASKIELLNDSN